MRMLRRGCYKLLLLLALLSTLLLLLFLTTVRMPPGPASSATLCSSSSLSSFASSDQLTGRGADPRDVSLYFTPRSRPITQVVSRFPLEPSLKTCASRLDLLILVPSPPEAALEREAVRNTWGSVVNKRWPQSSADRKVGLIFLLGTKRVGAGNFDPAALEVEAVRHGDLLVGDFVDSYRNLTRKVLAGLNWVSRRCSGRVSYVLKADLDMFVHVDRLLGTVWELQGAQPLTNTMLGEVLCSEPANRDPQSRVFVDPSLYPFPVYPPYVRGGSYVLSGELVTALVNASQHLPFLPVEDAFINGVVARTLHVRHINVPGVMRAVACPLSPCVFLGAGVVSATGVEPDMMRAIWRQLQEGPHLCHLKASWWTRACVWVSKRWG
ncbi:beta-1,3-galactosyltransferase 5-like [Babylonia areolata]|uniref:beta-1,3-galactosyltransferase 5-like n=1 Tax=Babylonia areolata TaxID=304850 RepID=UPI003FD19363